jgi:hypothetical protein
MSLRTYFHAGRFGFGLIFLSILTVLGIVALPGQAHAEGLQIRPLLYQQKLQPGESKKGFVDVSNATHTPITIVLRTKSFRQIDNKGNLQFFDSDTVAGAIRLDLTEVDLGPSEAVRVYFVIDGAKLPAGDNFAAIFAATKVETASGAAPSAQVGTLLVLENGSGGPHTAIVEKVSAPLVSFSDTLHATAQVRNPGQAKKSSAFFPQLTATVGPIFGVKKQFQGPLIFSGITRSVPVSIATKHRIGFYKLAVMTQDGEKSRWVFLVTGVWRFILFLAVVGVFVYWRWFRGIKLRLVHLPKQSDSTSVVDASPPPHSEEIITTDNAAPSVEKTLPKKHPSTGTKSHKSKTVKTKQKNTTSKRRKR